MTEEKGLYLVLLSLHGLIRDHDLELGRDADTGGQTKYVVELARALASHPEVARVDLLTRQVIDSRVSADYALPEECMAPGGYIVRIPCGPRRYLRKEVLWPYLDNFVDSTLAYFRRLGRVPDLLHSHYPDAGYIGVRLSLLLGIPLVHTGHSLGRVKRARLLAKGLDQATIETRYNMSQRIEAEEVTLSNAVLVIASSRQEVEEQYFHYENYHPERMLVIPPGVDLARFHPPVRGEPKPAIATELARFLREPQKPMILSLARADERKNLGALVCAYGENPRLREIANLVLIAGNREDLTSMEKGPRSVLTQLLFLIDRYDLYGHVAYPKRHEPGDVADLYRLAALTGGLHVNPALTEPFGLTLLESAASGLPVVATEDGGPKEIVGRCDNGLLVNPLDARALGETLLSALEDEVRWRRWARSGLRGVRQHYSWEGHVQSYLKQVRTYLPGVRKRVSRPPVLRPSRMATIDRLLVCDIDGTLLGDAEGLKKLLARMEEFSGSLGFAVATGRCRDSALEVLKKWNVKCSDVLITAVGSEILYGNNLSEDVEWSRHIAYRWNPDALREALRDVPGLTFQSPKEQGPFKISYYVDTERWPGVRAVGRLLRRLDLQVRYIHSHGVLFDLVPMRASKGLAVRYLASKWGLPLDRILVAGDSGNDEEMLCGNLLGVVVGNYSPELERCRDRERIYFARGQNAWGILEGIDHYGFLEPDLSTVHTHGEL